MEKYIDMRISGVKKNRKKIETHTKNYAEIY